MLKLLVSAWQGSTREQLPPASSLSSRSAESRLPPSLSGPGEALSIPVVTSDTIRKARRRGARCVLVYYSTFTKMLMIITCQLYKPRWIFDNASFVLRIDPQTAMELVHTIHRNYWRLCRKIAGQTSSALGSMFPL